MDQVQVPSLPYTLTFTAGRWSLTKLLIVNVLLTILTLGIYRFWAKTKVRQYFWRNVHFLDDPLEYTGTGKELFLGFLIVIAILFPLGLIYNSISLLVPPETVWLRVTLEFTYFVVLFALIQIAVYRAWRYRMSRTTWRGVRFGLDGSTGTYLKLAMGWSFLTLITLGLAYPWMKVDLWRYQVQHTRIGTERFGFEGDASDLLIPWLITSVPVYVATGSLASIFFMYGDAFASHPYEIRPLVSDDPTIFILGAIGIGFYALSPILFFWFSVRLTRLKISGMEIGTTAFYSALPLGRLLGFAILATLVCILAVAMLAGIVFGIGYFATPAITSRVEVVQLGQVIGFMISLFAFLFVFPLFWTVIFKFEALKQTILTMEIINPQALESVTQSAKDGPGTGEGLADALDVGGL